MKQITLDEAEKLALETDYAVFAVGEEINTADAGAFFLEGFNYCLKENFETVPDFSCATEDQKYLILKELTETTAKAVLTVYTALGLKAFIETKVVNQATGEEFILSFKKV